MPYCINPQDDEPIFCLFHGIGLDAKNPEKPYVDGNEFAKELLAMDGEGKKRIQIWINSEGGRVKDGYSIMAAMLKTKTKIDTLNIGLAYSMACSILAMGRKREALDYAIAMCHEPADPDDPESTDPGLLAMRTSLRTQLAGRMGKTVDEIAKLMKEETYFSPMAAKEAGMIDEVLPCNELNVPRGNAKEISGLIQSFGLKFVAKLLPKNEDIMINKKEVCTILGLDENTADSVVMAKMAEFKALASVTPKAKKKAGEDDDEGEEEEETTKKAKALKKETMKAEAKTAIVAKAKLAGLTMEDKDVEKYVALSGSKEALAIVLTEIEAKGTEAKKVEGDKIVAKAKTDITAKIAERKLTVDEKQVEKFVALAGLTEAGLKMVIETIESIPTTIASADITKFVGENGKGPKVYNAATIMDEVYKRTKRVDTIR